MPTEVASEIWTTADLELLPESSNRYETINGELLVTRAPNWRHQAICDLICRELSIWSQTSGLGRPLSGVGIIFSDLDNVIPDLIWISNQRLRACEDESGHFTAAPELVIEVLSTSGDKRDSQVKLKLYSSQGVSEYWLVDRFLQQIQVFRRENAKLTLAATLTGSDRLTSPLLAGFSCSLFTIFNSID
jgi:Uma2 family endonuclease